MISKAASKRPMRWIMGLLVLACSWLVADQPAAAQLFRRQSVYGPGRRNRSLESQGTIEGNERFLRRNRRAIDFVGRDRREGVGFVGATESGRPVQPRPLEITIVDRSAAINRPAPAAKEGQRYPPRLTPAFESPPAEPMAIRQDDLWSNLQDRGVLALGDATLLVEGRTAVLRGTVASDHQRRLAELLVSFEPGVSQVVNELQIARPEDNRLPQPLPPPTAGASTSQ